MLLDRLAEGDRTALLKLSRLVNSFFTRWNAYDFRDEWEDLIQEVLVAALQAHREDRIRERAHVYGFLKTVARNKFVDRLKREMRVSTDRRLPWEEFVDGELAPQEDPRQDELSADLTDALEALEERRRRAVLAVYVEGKTHAEAVEATGIPLGSLRRYLREGLAQLGRALATGPASGGAHFAGLANKTEET